MGNLITDAMLASRHGVNAAFVNSGAIRAGLLKGNITLANILTILPFENSLVEINLTGKNITDMLESVVGRWKNIISKERITSFVQVSGIRFKYNSTKPIYDRILEVNISSPNGIFEPVISNKTYRIMTCDFVSHGGDGLLPYPINVVPLEGMDDNLRNYIHTQRKVTPYLDNRIEDLALKHQIKPMNLHEPIHFGYNNSLNFQDDEIIIPQFQGVKVKTKSNTFIKVLLKAFCGPFC